MGKSSFIWNSRAYNGGLENEDHRAAKLRIGNLLLARGWSVRYEKEITINADWTVIADIYAAHPDKAQTIAIELDGAAHHTTSRTILTAISLVLLMPSMIMTMIFVGNVVN